VVVVSKDVEGLSMGRAGDAGAAEAGYRDAFKHRRELSPRQIRPEIPSGPSPTDRQNVRTRLAAW
jgi:hypothetical protein